MEYPVEVGHIAQLIVHPGELLLGEVRDRCAKHGFDVLLLLTL